MGVTTECGSSSDDHLHNSALESSSREVGRPEAGVSLPPRKRLLAGMKQNGLLPSPSCTPSPTCSSAWPSAVSSGKDLTAEVKLEVDLEGAKMAANSAVLEGGEESKLGDGDMDKDFQPKGVHEGTGPSSRSPSRASKRLGSVETKPGMSKESRQGHVLSISVGESKENRVVSASELGIASSSAKRKAIHRREVAEAAKLTAAMAAKSAAEAKAAAAEKAAAAAKAAAVAKAALDAAAAAEEAGNQCMDSSGRYSGAGFCSEDEKKKGDELAGERVSHTPPPIDDEEMARQLHRAINSSPRITRSHIALYQKKAEKVIEINTAMGGTSARQGSAQGKYARRRPSSSNEVSNLETKPTRQTSKRSQNGPLEADQDPESATTRKRPLPLSAPVPSQGGRVGDSTAAFEENACCLNEVAVRHASEEMNMDSRMAFVSRKICTVGDDQD